jgi:hypothetical protein
MRFFSINDLYVDDGEPDPSGRCIHCDKRCNTEVCSACDKTVFVPEVVTTVEVEEEYVDEGVRHFEEMNASLYLGIVEEF